MGCKKALSPVHNFPTEPSKSFSRNNLFDRMNAVRFSLNLLLFISLLQSDTPLNYFTHGSRPSIWRSQDVLFL